MDHLVDEDTQRPPVHTLVVTSRLEDLRSKVLWGSTQGPAPVTDHLREAEVSDDNMACVVKKNVLWLEVPFKNNGSKIIEDQQFIFTCLPINNAERMKVGQGRHNL